MVRRTTPARVSGGAKGANDGRDGGGRRILLLLCMPREDLLLPLKTVVMAVNEAAEQDDYKNAVPGRRISLLFKSMTRIYCEYFTAL